MRASAASVKGSGRSIGTLAILHYRTAVRFANKATRIESSNIGRAFEPAFFQELQSFCIGTILCSAAALECLVNELYIASDSPLRAKISSFEKEFWGERGIERKQTMRKYELALQLLGLPAIDKQAASSEDACILIALRNFVVHFKPTWDEKRGSLMRLEEQLMGRFPLSPFTDAGSDFVTMKCMSAGCAQWAVATCSAFVTDFRKASGLDSKKLAAFS